MVNRVNKGWICGLVLLGILEGTELSYLGHVMYYLSVY